MKLYNSRKWRVHRRNATTTLGNMNTGLPKSIKTKTCVKNGDCNLMTHGRESLYTQILPNNNLFTNSDNCGRSKKQIIRSGMQPKKGKNYCYDYNDYLKNKKKKTYESKIPSSLPANGQSNTFGHGGSCGLNDPCNENVTHYNPNNMKFRQQGAVDDRRVHRHGRVPAAVRVVAVARDVVDPARNIALHGRRFVRDPGNDTPDLRAG